MPALRICGHHKYTFPCDLHVKADCLTSLQLFADPNKLEIKQLIFKCFHRKQVQKCTHLRPQGYILYSRRSHCLGYDEVESIISICSIGKGPSLLNTRIQEHTHAPHGIEKKSGLKQVSLLSMFCEFLITLYPLPPILQVPKDVTGKSY